MDRGGGGAIAPHKFITSSMYSFLSLNQTGTYVGSSRAHYPLVTRNEVFCFCTLFYKNWIIKTTMKYFLELKRDFSASAWKVNQLSFSISL
jgi:hypothetical protein